MCRDPEGTFLRNIERAGGEGGGGGMHRDDRDSRSLKLYIGSRRNMLPDV